MKKALIPMPGATWPLNVDAFSMLMLGLPNSPLFPGMLGFLDANGEAKPALGFNALPTREAIRDHLSGNYCRCTGYHAIVDAVESVARARAAGEPSE